MAIFSKAPRTGPSLWKRWRLTPAPILRDRTGEEGEEESEALLDLTRPDLGVYERFTLCPSTKLGSAAGLTIHFPPAASGPYAGSDFHVTVPYTVFAKFLKPGMKGLFSGEPRQAEVSLASAI